MSMGAELGRMKFGRVIDRSDTAEDAVTETLNRWINSNPNFKLVAFSQAANGDEVLVWIVWREIE